MKLGQTTQEIIAQALAQLAIAGAGALLAVLKKKRGADPAAPGSVRDR